MNSLVTRDKVKWNLTGILWGGGSYFPNTHLEITELGLPRWISSHWCLECLWTQWCQWRWHCETLNALSRQLIHRPTTVTYVKSISESDCGNRHRSWLSLYISCSRKRDCFQDDWSKAMSWALSQWLQHAAGSWDGEWESGKCCCMSSSSYQPCRESPVPLVHSYNLRYRRQWPGRWWRSRRCACHTIMRIRVSIPSTHIKASPGSMCL